jgi:GT2 family glycosyltransferase
MMEPANNNPPDLTIVTLTWNSQKHIKNCVDYTLRDVADAGLTCEFFIVDNGSKDGTQDILVQLGREHPEIRTWLLGENQGTTAARNMVLSQGAGRYFCILDSDAYPHRGCLSRLVGILETDSSIGIAVPRIVYPDGRYQKSVDHFPTLGGKLRRAVMLRRIELDETPPGRGSVPCAISAFWIFRRKVLEDVGLLDEHIFYSPEDVDFCLSVWEKGYSVFHEPDAVAVHDAQERSRNLLPNSLTFSHIKGLCYLFWKHRYIFRPPRYGCNQP